MKFETFDRDAVHGDVPGAGPVVRVDRFGRLLFNDVAWSFLVSYCAPPSVRWDAVTLLFDAESRTAAVRPVAPRSADEQTPEGSRWPVRRMRSAEWPHGVDARPFVDHYQLGMASYGAKLLRGPGPRMVTFGVGSPQRLPVGVPPEGTVSTDVEPDE